MLQKRREAFFLGWVLLIFGAAVLFHKLTDEAEKIFLFAFLLTASLATIIIGIRKKRSDLYYPAGFAFFYGVGVLFAIRLPIFHSINEAVLLFGIFGYFLLLAQKDERRWWAILLAGLCFAQATALLVCGLGLLPQPFGAFIFFFGSGLTFLYLKSYSSANRMGPDWAAVSAFGCFLLAAVALLKAFPQIDVKMFVAGFLIAVGAYLIFRFVRRQ